jgi:hypothetical protein
MITTGGNTDTSNWGAEFNQWVSSVVRVGRASLAFGTEIGVVADSALVTVTTDEL